MWRMPAAIEIKSTVKVFTGSLIRFSHMSAETKTTMTCAVYLPQETSVAKKFPSLMYLSGLTCTDENVCQKSGCFKALSEMQMGFIAPDTSPRGAGVAGETDSWDFGVGAGFYLDATAEAWKENYRMYSYITKELPSVISSNFPSLDLTRLGITGHSMGGHGAMTVALRNQDMFKSVSAFSPISNPMNCPWGKKAFSGYLGPNEESWKQYDATELIKNGKSKYDDILIDCGTGDNFYKQGQLLPEAFGKAAEEVGQKTTIRLQNDYDHSYYFISSFMDDHIKFHKERL